MLFAQTEAPTKRNANKVVMKLINDGLAAGCSISKSENVFAYNNKLNYNTGYVISIYSSCDDIDALRNAIAEVNLKKNFVFWANPVINDEQTEEWANQKIDYQSKPFSHFEEFNKNNSEEILKYIKENENEILNAAIRYNGTEKIQYLKFYIQDEFVGLVGYTHNINDSNVCDISVFYIDEKHRDNGIGELMLESFEYYVKSKNNEINVFRLHVDLAKYNRERVIKMASGLGFIEKFLDGPSDIMILEDNKTFFEERI